MAARTQRARATHVGVLQPDITETIARLLPGPDAFAAFVAALPAWAKTPLLASIARLLVAPSMAVAWPTITVLSPQLDSATIEDLVAAATLGPCSIVIGYTIETHDDLAVVADVASSITSLKFDLDGTSKTTLRFFRSTIASCTHLASLELKDSTWGEALRTLKGVFFKLEHLTSLALLNSSGDGDVELSTGFCERLVHWLQTRPVVSLKMYAVHFADAPDSPLCLVLYDAISSSTTLALDCVNILEHSFMHQRPLPVHLTSLEWDPSDFDNAYQSWYDFQGALEDGPQLTHLSCKNFVKLLDDDDDEIPRVLQGLSSLAIHCKATSYEVLNALKTMSNLTALVLQDIGFKGEVMRDFVGVLRKLPYLEVLKFPGDFKQVKDGDAMSTTDVVHLLQHVPRFACLAHLDVADHKLDMTSILGLLPTLNAAAKRLQKIRLQSRWQQGDVEAFVAAVGQLLDRHFAIVFDPRVVDAATNAHHKLLIEKSGLAPRRGVAKCIVYV
ncbi:hypothetical protein, variant [Saprolegnia diclina VS20]|uniref:FBD domain-containing protein n=1 Tax=Saprolegnia diclina (strain VS20) TaxID=1156394 RepID=T0QAM0_SAPDV|nr:hypothetical protein SDRG_10517 [Saprolegnia diclina VS20]XP_008614733.1 hypothetical protein, variant [Saprolegnia diclina VS20]EQC31725.1 hypothetical protein SDRG_10517 [Saprolegnia diclina VS20]EQC31726.1 hypothetical protein, variant [Saprolegnia diclina VS20]|eukprot:XP_008614732.1 hypothetical protein SDRG_10517 [Saprolegnia diclina VS20]